MRIALISEEASPLAALGGIDAGGQNIQVAHVASCLVKLGHHVDVYTRRDDAQQPPVVQLSARLHVLYLAAGPARFVPHNQLLRHTSEFADCCEHLCAAGPRYDVVHATGFASGSIALRLKQRLGLPYVLGLQPSDASPAGRSPREQAIVREAEAIIDACLQPQADEVAPTKRLDTRRELGLDASAFIVLQLGNLVPREGIENVVRAIALMPHRTAARLLVVGGDSNPPNEHTSPEIGRLRGIARSLGVDDLVSFAGCPSRERLWMYCAASNVCVSTPWYEPTIATLLDAMACGMPVIASGGGALPHVVVDGLTGYLVPPNDPAALAEHLLYLHAHPALARALGLAGMRHAHTVSAWDTRGAQLIAAYQDLPARLEARRRAAMPLRAAAANGGGTGERTVAASLPLITAT